MKLQKGDAILVTCEGRTVEGEILMISDNQVSALIRFDILLGQHADMMPIVRHDLARGIYRSIIDGTEVTMRRKP